MFTDANAVTCPVCAATAVQAVSMNAGNTTKGAITEALFGTAAGTAAGQGSVIRIVCMKCGHKWEPGSANEAMMRLLRGGTTEQERQLYRRNLVNGSLDAAFTFLQPFIVIGVVFLVAIMVMKCG